MTVPRRLGRPCRIIALVPSSSSGLPQPHCLLILSESRDTRRTRRGRLRRASGNPWSRTGSSRSWRRTYVLWATALGRRSGMPTTNVVGSRDVSRHVVERGPANDAHILFSRCFLVQSRSPYPCSLRVFGHSRSSMTRPLSCKRASVKAQAADPCGAFRRTGQKALVPTCGASRVDANVRATPCPMSLELRGVLEAATARVSCHAPPHPSRKVCGPPTVARPPDTCPRGPRAACPSDRRSSVATPGGDSAAARRRAAILRRGSEHTLVCDGGGGRLTLQALGQQGLPWVDLGGGGAPGSGGRRPIACAAQGSVRLTPELDL